MHYSVFACFPIFDYTVGLPLPALQYSVFQCCATCCGKTSTFVKEDDLSNLWYTLRTIPITTATRSDQSSIPKAMATSSLILLHGILILLIEENVWPKSG